MRFLTSAAGSALEASFDDADGADLAPAPGAPVVGRSRLLGLVPGETKLVTFDGVLFEVTMEPGPADAVTTDSTENRLIVTDVSDHR